MVKSPIYKPWSSITIFNIDNAVRYDYLGNVFTIKSIPSNSGNWIVLYAWRNTDFSFCTDIVVNYYAAIYI